VVLLHILVTLHGTLFILRLAACLLLYTAPPTAALSTLSLHDALPILSAIFEAIAAFDHVRPAEPGEFTRRAFENGKLDLTEAERSEEHTSELQSRFDLVCRLLLEKKKKHI